MKNNKEMIGAQVRDANAVLDEFLCEEPDLVVALKKADAPLSLLLSRVMQRVMELERKIEPPPRLS